MSRPNYVCTTCSEHFTRKYSAKRHNITVHHNIAGDIVPFLEYLVGRNSGKYEASHPSWYRRSEKGVHNFGRAMIADSIGGDAFLRGAPQREQQGQYQPQYHQQSLEEQERYRRQWQQEQSLSPSPATIQDQPPDVMSPYPTDPTFQSQSMNTMDKEQTTTLSHETRLKIEELKRLVYKYPQYHYNPAAVIACVTHFAINGDNMILDEKLEQLRTLDSAMGYPRM